MLWTRECCMCVKRMREEGRGILENASYLLFSPISPWNSLPNLFLGFSVRLLHSLFVHHFLFSLYVVLFCSFIISLFLRHLDYFLFSFRLLHFLLSSLTLILTFPSPSPLLLVTVIVIVIVTQRTHQLYQLRRLQRSARQKE